MNLKLHRNVRRNCFMSPPLQQNAIQLNELHSVSPALSIMNNFQFFIFISPPTSLHSQYFLRLSTRQKCVTNLIIPISVALFIYSNWKFKKPTFFHRECFSYFFSVVHRGNWRFRFSIINEFSSRLFFA